MNNHLITLFSLITSSSLFIVGCGDTSTLENPVVTGALNNEIQTQIADLDSFSLATEKIAIEALEREGYTSNISIYVADRNNNPVPDNTSVLFEASWGQVEPQCLTIDGACSVTWTEAGQNQFLPASLDAVILAYTVGEESFTDLNDNDLFDSGEPFTDISEPFLDVNNNAVRDASTEEFIDSDRDNTFDLADGLFTGTPCVGDNTVCNRVSTFIWDITRINLSSSNADISIVSGTLPTTADTTASLTISVTDINGNIMADVTTVGLSSTEGTVDPTSIDLAAGQTLFNINYTTGSASGSESLTIDVTSSPSGLVTTKPFTTTIP